MDNWDYPCTIWSARYDGWYAMPCEPCQVQPGFEDDAEDWMELVLAIRQMKVPFGRGQSAAEAFDDLARQVEANPDWSQIGHPLHPGIIYPGRLPPELSS